MEFRHGFAALIMSLLVVSPLVSGAAYADADEDGHSWAELGNNRSDLDALHANPAHSWRLSGLEVPGLGLANLDVRAVEVFEPAARVITSDGESETIEPPPGTRFMRGRIEHIPGSVVALTVVDDGTITGLMTDGETTWTISRSASMSTLQTEEVARETAQIDEPFVCDNEHLIEPMGTHLNRLGTSEPTPIVPLAPGDLYKVTVAIETDYEFFQMFGSSTLASEYIGTLFNYISGIYEVETQTRFVLGDIFLWNTANDPWVETGGTVCRLYEFGRYWRNHRGGVSRAIAHFLSGRSLGGGVAWMDSLCAAPRLHAQATGCASVGNELVYGGFGVSANLSGTFATPSGIAWDAIVVAHEMGHSAGSPHTHCYGGLGGVADPVDGCWNQESGSGCWSGSAGLPGTGSITGGTPGARQGTIMSYCHQRTGGLANIASTFGWGHPFGILANRVPDRIFDRIASVSAGDPDCIPVIQQEPWDVSVIVSGNGRVTSDPAGIDCGPLCSAGFVDGGTLTLTAVPDKGFDLARWGGACGGAGATCVLGIDSPTLVTAEFVPLPKLFNISTRAHVRDGAGVLIGGFVIRGTEPQRVLIRARGPSLISAGILDAMSDPRLHLFAGASQIGFNDNWRDGGQDTEISASGRAPTFDQEAALAVALAPGAYTVQVLDSHGATGTAIVEVIALDETASAGLFNLSTRAIVETGDRAAIGGFVIHGDAAKQVLIRARGPSLGNAGVAGALMDPTLELFSGANAIAFNNDWKHGGQESEINATGRAPVDDSESALLRKLEPGAYTAIVRGYGGTTGIGIIEVIAVDEDEP